jgi:hypothetical protein
MVGVDNTKGGGAAIRVNTSSPSAENIRISKSSESSKQHAEGESLVKDMVLSTPTIKCC